MRFPVSTGLTIAIAGGLLALSPKVAPALKAPNIQSLTSLADFSPERTPFSPLARHVEEPPPIVVHLRQKSAAPLLEDAPTDSHALATSDHEEIGAAQESHKEDVAKDLGWNEDMEEIPDPLVGGLTNQQVWLLVRRFNMVK